MIDFKRHIKNYINVNTDDFRIFRVGPNDFESELTRNENQFQYIPHNSKFITKLGPILKYGEYLVPVFKLIKNTVSFSAKKFKKSFAIFNKKFLILKCFTYLCEFMIEHGISVYEHKILLKEDLKDECNEDIQLDRMRIRKKQLKHPSTILLDDQIFGRDMFINSSTELCVEILDGPELKTEKSKIAIYLRKWNPVEYELEPIEEVFVDGQMFDGLLRTVCEIEKVFFFFF